MFQISFKDVSRKCLQNVCRMLKGVLGSFKGVSCKFIGCFKEVSRAFQGSVREISRVF